MSEFIIETFAIFLYLLALAVKAIVFILIVGSVLDIASSLREIKSSINSNQEIMLKIDKS